jgi:hypothetical protein
MLYFSLKPASRMPYNVIETGDREDEHKKGNSRQTFAWNVGCRPLGIRSLADVDSPMRNGDAGLLTAEPITTCKLVCEQA